MLYNKAQIKKIRLWLHKSNFKQLNYIKALARYILFKIINPWCILRYTFTSSY